MSNPVIVVGSYDNCLRAEADYERLASNARELWDERVYALGLVERTPAGHTRVVNHLEPDTNIGTISGTVVGGLVGLLYPPFIVISAAAGGAIGRAATHLWHGVSRKDLAELGHAVDAGQGAVLVIAQRLPEDLTSVLPHAAHVVHRSMQHKHEDIDRLIEQLRDDANAAGDVSSAASPPASS